MKQHHHNLSPSKFSNSEDYANNNELPSTANATVNLSLSPAKSSSHHQSASPSALQASSSYNSSDPIGWFWLSWAIKINSISVIEHMHGVFDWKGGSLKCVESGVELIVPESAIPFGCQQELFVKVCRENHHNPPLDMDKQEALMSPLVMCGPQVRVKNTNLNGHWNIKSKFQGVRFEVPVELKLPHDSMATTSNNSSGYNNEPDGSAATSPTSFVLKSGSGANWRNIEVSC